MKKCMDFSGSDALKKKSRIPQKNLILEYLEEKSKTMCSRYSMLLHT
jgi:hypothetical protein